MRYLHGKVKANKGGKIRVKISAPTRVLIMNSKNYKRYSNNQTFTYYGGKKEGEFEFAVPTAIHWHVVVEKGTYKKPSNITATIEVEKPIVKERARGKGLATSFDEADAQMDKASADEAVDVEDKEQ